MPNSLKCKVKHLCHNRTITESECDRILKALEQESCEDAVLMRVIQEIKAEIRYFMFEVNPSSSESDYACNYILDLIDKYIGKEFEWIQEQK